MSAAGIEALLESIRWLRELRGAGIRTAAVSWSTNAPAVLRAATFDAHVDVTIDGRDVDRLGPTGKPASDGFLEAARRLAVAPAASVS